MDKRNKLEISGQYLHCPLFLSIDTYEGCSNQCRYCYINNIHARQHRGGEYREEVQPALITRWEKVLRGESIGNPMIEYLVSNRHPIQFGTKSEPFPRHIEGMAQTRKFLELCNQFQYPVYITTKNTDNMPIDLLTEGNYFLGVSLCSHKSEDIQILEINTSSPSKRIQHIPKGVFRKVIIRWHPFIPQLFMPGKARNEIINWSALTDFLDLISEKANGVTISFLGYSGFEDQSLLEKIGPDTLDELDEVEILTFIQEEAHKRGLEFYSASYRALSDSPICCGLREDELEISTPFVWGHLIAKLFNGKKEYLTENDLKDAFPDELKDVPFATMQVPLYSRWARYSSQKTTILEEYRKNFLFDRKMNPVNYFAGLYSRVVDGEFRIYFKDYRQQLIQID